MGYDRNNIINFVEGQGAADTNDYQAASFSTFPGYVNPLRANY